MSDIESESVIAQQKRYIAALEARIDGLKQDAELWQQWAEYINKYADFHPELKKKLISVKQEQAK